MHRILALVLLSLLLVAGCQGVEEYEETVEQTVSGPPAATVEPRAPAATFASVDEGLVELIAATDAKDSKRQKDAYNWLAQQGPSAVPAVVAAMNNSSASIESRRIACRVLAQLGAAAAQPLVEASRSSEMPLKLKAIEAMPVVDPQQKIIVDRLIELLDDGNDGVRRAAIRALGQIGPAAQRAGDKLIALRNNVDLDEMTRDEADRAVQRVVPRKTFED